MKIHLFGIFYYRTKIKNNQNLIANKNWEHTAQVCSTIQYDVNMFVFIKARKSDLCRKELKSFFFFYHQSGLRLSDSIKYILLGDIKTD